MWVDSCSHLSWLAQEELHGASELYIACADFSSLYDEQCSIVYACHVIHSAASGILDVSMFWKLWIMLLVTWLCKCAVGTWLQISQGKYLEVALVSVLFLIFRGTACCFPTMAHSFTLITVLCLQSSVAGMVDLGSLNSPSSCHRPFLTQPRNQGKLCWMSSRGREDQVLLSLT